MAERETFQIVGLKLLLQQLRDLDSRDGGAGIKALRAAVRKAAKPMAERARQLVPYDINDPDGPDGYHIRDHIQLRSEAKRLRRTEVEYRLGPIRRVSNGKVEGGLSGRKNSPNYAGIIENEQPYLRPAFDATVAGFVQTFKTELGANIGRRVKRLERAGR